MTAMLHPGMLSGTWNHPQINPGNPPAISAPPIRCMVVFVEDEGRMFGVELSKLLLERSAKLRARGDPIAWENSISGGKLSYLPGKKS
jgi:hypothetical protein